MIDLMHVDFVDKELKNWVISDFSELTNCFRRVGMKSFYGYKYQIICGFQRRLD